MTQQPSQRGKQGLMQLLFLFRWSIEANVFNFLSAVAAGSAGVRWSLTGKQSARCGTTHPPESVLWMHSN